jgi:hypothetical protein
MARSSDWQRRTGSVGWKKRAFLAALGIASFGSLAVACGQDPGVETNRALGEVAGSRAPLTLAELPPSAPVNQCFLQVPAPACENHFQTIVNGEGGTVQCSGIAACNYLEAARSFPISESPVVNLSGHADPRTQFVDSWGATPGSTHSLLFEGYQHADFVERLELNLSTSGEGEASRLQFGEWRYLRYFIRVHRSFVPDPNMDVLITQVWQRDSNSLTNPADGRVVRPSTGPAFSVNLTGQDSADPPLAPNSVYLKFDYRNDSFNEAVTAFNPGRDFRVNFLRHAIPKDTWIGFMIAMKPVYEPIAGTSDPTGRGAIFVWQLDTTTGLAAGPITDDPVTHLPKVNGQLPLNSGNYAFYWGFRPERLLLPTSDPNYVGGFQDGFDIRVGIYRSSNEYSTLWFDDIKLTNHEACLPGTTFNTSPACAAPACP